MINLTTTSHKIQIATGTTANIDVHASWMDGPIPIVNGASYTPGDKDTLINTATTTDVVLSPPANQVRNVKALIVRNAHSSNSNSVQISHTNGTQTVKLWEG